MLSEGVNGAQNVTDAAPDSESPDESENWIIFKLKDEADSLCV